MSYKLAGGVCRTALGYAEKIIFVNGYAEKIIFVKEFSQFDQKEAIKLFQDAIDASRRFAAATGALVVGFMQIFTLITQLLPLLASAIKSAQQIIGATHGEIKKAFVKSIVANAIELSPAEQHPAAQIPPELLNTVLDKVIDTTVSALKISGQLESSAKQSAEQSAKQSAEQ